MMVLNCLIIDDEPLARQQIAAYIDKIPYLKLVGSARNALIAKDFLALEPVDLIFLDINMPQMNGIDFIRKSALFQQIIIITAFPEYALDGFDVEVTDYLMKPVKFERFLKAVEKAKIRIGGSDFIRYDAYQPSSIYIKHQQVFEKIIIEDILFIESMLNYVQIVLKDKKYKIYSSLKAIEGVLPNSAFMKIHKSFIVALAKIDSIKNQQLTIGEYILPISRAAKNELIRTVNKISPPKNT